MLIERQHGNIHAVFLIFNVFVNYLKLIIKIKDFFTPTTNILSKGEFMARIPETTIEEVKQKSDIVDIVSSYVSLNKRSAQNLFGLCPFHQEKTPSFSVSTNKQIYYCFGCQKGGDVIHFIMDIEHLSYPEAIRFLAEKAGVEIVDDQDNDERYQIAKEHRARLYALNIEAARYFYLSLQDKSAFEVRTYMKDRGIKSTAAKSFGIGFAPDRWQGLYDHLIKKNYSEEEIADSGLFKKNKQGRWYDLFRNRLIFPIIDVMGRIVAFGGRVIDDSMPKYLNSPETKIYTKGQHLYSLNLAKKSKAKRLIIVEGYMDCLALHQAGFTEAVASLGTALTEQQAALLRKYREEVILSYDMDQAGRLATLKNIDVLESKSVQTYVLKLDDGVKDPDDYLKNHSASDFQYLLGKSIKGIDYKFEHVRFESMRGDELDKLRYQELASDLLLSIHNPVMRQLYIPVVAGELGVDEETLQLLLNMKEKEKQNKEQPRGRVQNQQQKYNETTNDTSNDESIFTGSVLNPKEEALLYSLIKEADIYLRLNIKVKAKWFQHREIHNYVENILELIEEKKFEDQDLFQLETIDNDQVKDRLRSQIANLLMQDYSISNEEESANRIKKQILLVKQAYLLRLSRYFTKVLDHPREDYDTEEIRKRFISVRQEMSQIERILRSMDLDIKQD